MTAIVAGYIAMCNETDPKRRRTLVAQPCTADATYLDPLIEGEGHDGIDAMIAGAQQQYPGHRFRLAVGPDTHHDRVRFTWHLVGDPSPPVAVGIDFATLADDGRLRSITGFF